MNTMIINSLTFIMLLFSINTLSNENRLKSIVEFTKMTDKNDLIKLLTKLQNEKIILQSSISEHSIKCQSVLDTCKNKFSQPGCQTTHNIKKQELEDTIKTTILNIKDNQDILTDLQKLIINTKKDCKDITHFYHSSKDKLNQDDKKIKGIKTQVKDSLHKLKSQMNFTTTNTTNPNIRVIKSATNKSPLQVIDSKPAINKSPVIVRTIKNVPKTNSLTNLPKLNNVTNKVNVTTKKENKTVSVPSPQSKIAMKNNNDTNVKSMNISKSLLIDIDDSEEDEVNKGFLGNIFEKITGFFSLIQLKDRKHKSIQDFSFASIQSNMNKILQPPQKINFLITTLHEFNVVVKSIRESIHNLKESYKESKRSCRKRISTYENKLKYSYDLLEESKVNLEIYKSKINLKVGKLKIEESKLRLCEVRSNDLMLCNKMNKYCETYNEEYKAEERELDDLIMFFKTFIEKYN